MTAIQSSRSRPGGAACASPEGPPRAFVSIARSDGEPPDAMAKTLRSQLNQIRAWVRQGRTDAWIAHQLEVSTAELREFRRRHSLDADGEEAGDADLRDEIEAEIAAASREREKLAEEPEEAPDEEGGEEGATDEDAEGGRRPRRRRRRRGRGGGGGRPGAGMQAAFDHGDEGYGLWLDPAIADDPIYAENWAGKRRVEVTVEPDQIVIKRSD